MKKREENESPFTHRSRLNGDARKEGTEGDMIATAGVYHVDKGGELLEQRKKWLQEESLDMIECERHQRRTWNKGERRLDWTATDEVATET